MSSERAHEGNTITCCFLGSLRALIFYSVFSSTAQFNLMSSEPVSLPGRQNKAKIRHQAMIFANPCLYAALTKVLSETMLGQALRRKNKKLLPETTAEKFITRVR